ncbi:hypothetical protein [uncultured Cyclobacterium sp.]|uniref:hypothetical protein n=1 Tax=uncultured Cyclobacterium sp. TaxID=453820 RepID=UPI0030EC9E7B|tara:strand:+ start:11091 stop:12266 length:1176 start_codon:yes stop_codon:yes gene_type:complete
MKQFVLTICFFILSQTLFSYSPNCRDLKKWISIADEILPEEKNKVRLEKDFVRVYAIAYHDVYFKPIFGKSYAQMSSEEKEAIYKKLNKCAKDIWVIHGLSKGFRHNVQYKNLWYSSIVGINRMTIEQHRQWQQKRQARLDRTLNPTPEDLKKYRDRKNLQRHINKIRAQEEADKRAKARANVPIETLRKEAHQMESVLNPVKHLDAPNFEFKGYKNSKFLKQIYNGEFTNLNISSLGEMFNLSLDESLELTRTIQKRVDWLYSYLNYFSDICAQNNPENFTEFSPQYIYTDTDINGRQTERIGSKKTYYIKAQFYKIFKDMDENQAADQGLGFLTRIDRTDEILKEMPEDLKRLFTEFGCDHPILQKLEVNLFLAVKGKSPLQKLIPLMD